MLTFCEPCNGCSIQWTTIDGQIDTGADTANPQISQPGTYVVTVTNMQGLNSRESIVVTANFNLPTANAGPDQELTCRTDQVSVGDLFSTGPDFIYSWTDESQLQISDQPQLITSTEGVFTFVVTDTTNGCLASDEVLVTLDTVEPQISLDPPGTLNCITPSITLNASASSAAHDATFSWSSNTGSDIIGINSPTPLINTPGNYSLLMEDIVNGCSSTITITVNGNFTPPPINNIPGAALNCRDESAILSGNSPPQPGFDFQWCQLQPDGSLINCSASYRPNGYRSR